MQDQQGNPVQAPVVAAGAPLPWVQGVTVRLRSVVAPEPLSFDVAPGRSPAWTVLDNIEVGRHSRTRKGFLAKALRAPGVAAEAAESEHRAFAPTQTGVEHWSRVIHWRFDKNHWSGALHPNTLGVPIRQASRLEKQMDFSSRRMAAAGLCVLLSACNSVMEERGRQRSAATVDRLYVIDCGETHAKDLSLWTTDSDKGKAHVFSNNCYLIRHRTAWMLWDSGNADRIATMPNGLVNPRGTLTFYMRKPLAESLKEIAVAPGDITHFAMSHSHGDHSGNANLFARATIYMQTAEYAAIYGPEPQKLGIPPANFETLRDAKIVKLNGDHDVFGDGSVVIKSTPGHTPGHQSLFVRLPKTGPVILSGDFVHLKTNWQAMRVPLTNYDREQSARSMREMDSFVKATGAQLWINHDSEQPGVVPKAPAFVE